MSNPSKARGDRFELKAKEFLVELVDPVLTVERPDRMLGAGRREDVGDLCVLPDVAIQVKAHNDYLRAIWLACDGAKRQAGNAGYPLHLGMVPVPRARATSVNWVFATLDWPVDIDDDAVAVFGTPARAVAHIRNDTLGIPRAHRVALIRRASTPAIWVAPAQAWLSAYVQRLESFAPVPLAV